MQQKKRELKAPVSLSAGNSLVAQRRGQLAVLAGHRHPDDTAYTTALSAAALNATMPSLAAATTTSSSCATRSIHQTTSSAFFRTSLVGASFVYGPGMEPRVGCERWKNGARTGASERRACTRESR